MFLSGFVLREEPCTDPYARFCGQTGAAAPSDPISGIAVRWSAVLGSYQPESYCTIIGYVDRTVLDVAGL